MEMRELLPGFRMLSDVRKDLRIFQGDSYTDSGLMTNAYLITDKNNAILFGTLPAGEMERQQFVGKKLTYVSFCQRGDVNTIAFLNSICPELTVIGSAMALLTVDTPCKKICIRGRKVLRIGERTYVFQSGNGGNLLVSCEDIRTVISGSAYGSYCAYDELLLSGIRDKTGYYSGAKNYCRDNHTRWEINDNTKLICPLYGPAVDTNLGELAGLYTDNQEKTALLQVAVVYDGQTDICRLAQKAADGLRESGEIEIHELDLSEINRDQVLAAARQADALLLGCAEVNGTVSKAVMDTVTSLGADNCKGKLACVLWAETSSRCDAERLSDFLKRLGFSLPCPELHCTGKPDEEMQNAAFEQGFAFGCHLQRIPNPRAPKLVKCLVCGEVFDASLGICPVCGVGLDRCIPADGDVVTYSCDTDRHYLIIGGGIAGVCAAEAIRKRDKTGSIEIISAEPELPINRPMLTKDLRMCLDRPEELAVHDLTWYDERNIRLRLGKRVLSIDPVNHAVLLDSGEETRYDKLIYALGGECFVPPFKGADKKGVISIRHLSDVAALENLLRDAQNAVVIGGGVLGLEAASELHRFGLKVTVLESAPQICGRQIDEKNASTFRRIMERMGVPCCEGISISEICGNERVSGVRLNDGREFPADLIVISCGVRSSIALAQTAGIQVDRSVVVDQHMNTSVEDIYACGDCAAFDGINLQLWAEAGEQGKVAGANAAGEPLCFANKPLGFSLAAFGASLFALGDVGKQGKTYRTVELTDSVRGKAESYWFVGSRLEGAVLLNRDEKIDSISTAVSSHARYDELF